MTNSVPIFDTMIALILSMSILRFMALFIAIRTFFLQVVQTEVADQQTALLLLLVIVKLENRTTQVHRFYLSNKLPPFMNSLTMLFSDAIFKRSNLLSIDLFYKIKSSWQMNTITSICNSEFIM